MPTIPLTDALGLDLDGKLASDAKLSRILPQFAQLRGMRLDQVPVEQARAKLVFDEPLHLPIPGLAMQLGAKADGSVALLKSSHAVLDYNEPFDYIGIKPNEIYIRIGLKLSAIASAGVSIDSFSFGLSAEAELDITCYRRFKSESDGFPFFGAAFFETARRFVLPKELTDFANLDTDTVLVLSGAGTLAASAGFSIGTPVTQLATASPVAGHPIQVEASGSFSAQLGIQLIGTYQVRLRRLPNAAIELSIYKEKAKEFTCAVSAEAGIAANIDGFDLASEFIDAISPGHVLNKDEFKKALPGEDQQALDLKIHSFKERLASAVSTSVQVSVTAAFSKIGDDEAIWQFEIDLQAATSDQAKKAILSALRGDFSPLTHDPKSLPAGIKQTANIFTRTDLSKQTLKVNLLGMVNFFSTSRLARISTIEKAADGEITLLADAAGERQLKALILNCNGDSNRLRHLLNEDFLIQASYKVTPTGVLPPEFSARHSFFDIENNPARDVMKNLLDVTRAVGLMREADESAHLQAFERFGRTTFYLQSVYESGDVQNIFLKDGVPRSIDDYELQGRLALANLLEGDPGQPFRKLLADTGPAGNAKWQAMKRIGNPAGFNAVFGRPLDEVNPDVAAAGADYFCITRWAAAMHDAGLAIREVLDVFNTKGLTDARRHLKDRLADVVKHSQEHFGDPLGLVMVFFASNSSGKARAILTSERLGRIELASAPALTVGARGA